MVCVHACVCMRARVREWVGGVWMRVCRCAGVVCVHACGACGVCVCVCVCMCVCVRTCVHAQTWCIYVYTQMTMLMCNLKLRVSSLTSERSCYSRSLPSLPSHPRAGHLNELSVFLYFVAMKQQQCHRKQCPLKQLPG